MTVRPAASRTGRPLALSAAVATLAAAAVTHGAPAAAAGPTFTAPVQIPNSAGLGEPSIAVDSKGRLFVTAPQSLGNITGGGSLVWTSSKAGAQGSWNAGVAPTGDPLSGGDTDLAIDAADNVYQADLWLGNSALAVSTDHGASFLANEYGHTTPGDDRPWLAYSKKDNALYMVWDGVTALYAQKSLPLSPAPQAGILPGQTTAVIPESLIGGSLVNALGSSVRQCVCPPGGIAVDPTGGQVYVTYSKQNGSGLGGAVGVAVSTDSGLTWTNTSIPGTGSTGSAFDVEYNFIPVKVDSNGTVYAVWGEGRKIVKDSGGNFVATGGVAIKYAYSKDHGAHWSTPVTLSTSSGTTTFPTLDVVSPGVIDVAWYGTSATGDPNTVPASASWNVVFARVSAANTATPAFTPSVAVSGIHTGCIQTGSAGSLCSDRSLLDFFQLAVDHSGAANIIYAKGQATANANATNLWFTRQLLGTTTTTTSTKHTSQAPAGNTPRNAANTAYRARSVYYAIRSI
jgi:hypothetical protein